MGHVCFPFLPRPLRDRSGLVITGSKLFALLANFLRSNYSPGPRRVNASIAITLRSHGAAPKCRQPDVRRLLLHQASGGEVPACRRVVASGTNRSPRMPHETSSAAMSLEALRARWRPREAALAVPAAARTRRPAPPVPRPRRRVTLAQIAEETGLSMATVSKVLNGKPDVSVRTRALVRQALLTSGYRKRANETRHRSSTSCSTTSTARGRSRSYGGPPPRPKRRG